MRTLAWIGLAVAFSVGGLALLDHRYKEIDGPISHFSETSQETSPDLLLGSKQIAELIESSK